MTHTHGNGARDGWAPFDVQRPALLADSTSLAAAPDNSRQAGELLDATGLWDAGSDGVDAD